MLIVMKHDATDSQIETVLRVIEQLGFKGHPMPGATRTAIGITGNQGAVDPSHFENLGGVAEAIRVSKPYNLITLDLRPEKTIVRVGDAAIGGEELAIIAGPCAIESRTQAFAIAEAVRRSGARFFRGGAFKPRTSPYAFQGLGEEGLRILAEVREVYGLKIVTEALDEAVARQVAAMLFLDRVLVHVHVPVHALVRNARSAPHMFFLFLSFLLWCKARRWIDADTDDHYFHIFVLVPCPDHSPCIDHDVNGHASVDRTLRPPHFANPWCRCFARLQVKVACSTSEC